jgi:membrane protease YdiL (CAAX protease family)
MERKLSIRSVNLLFLVVLCLQASNLLLMWIPQYVRMILNEALFVLGPALLYLALTRLPFRETVRLRWPGGRVAGLSLLIGMGLYPLAAWSAVIYQQLLGYRLSAAPHLLPTTAVEGVLALIAYSVMAPVCEEILCRGVIQRAYESRGPRRAVLFAGGLFIIFQGLSIIPLALALGYVYWRSASLPASMLTHFGANFMAASVITGGVFWRGAETIILSAPALIAGLVLAGLSLWQLKRATAPPPPEIRPAAAPWPARAWPLLAAGVLWLGAIGLEVQGARSPARAAGPVQLQAAPWDAPVRWRYEVRNIVDMPVGQAQCELVPAPGEFVLTCHKEAEAYEVDTGSGLFIGASGTEDRLLRWQRGDLRPMAGESSMQGADYKSGKRWTLEATVFTVTIQDGENPVEIFASSLDSTLKENPFVTVEDGWAWQFVALPFAADYTAGATVVQPYAWDQKTQQSKPLAAVELVKVTGSETVVTPAGTFIAWRVELGPRQVAWYDTAAPHTLVKYFNGMETWVLAGSE